MENENFRIYNVKVKNQSGQLEERKCIDAYSLLVWLDLKEKLSSILTIDLDKVPEGKSIEYIMAKVAVSNIAELKILLQDLLGLLPKQDDNDEDAVIEEPRQNPPEPKPQPKPKPKQSEVFEDKEDNINDLHGSDDDDEIVL